MEVAIAHAGVSLAAFAVMARAEYRHPRGPRRGVLALYAGMALIPFANAVLAWLVHIDIFNPEKPYFDDGIFPWRD